MILKWLNEMPEFARDDDVTKLKSEPVFNTEDYRVVADRVGP